MLKQFGFCTAIVALALFQAGCPNEGGTGRTMDPADNVANTNPPETHEHVLGPHQGHLLELDPLHAELVMDADRNLTVYLLGEDGKTAAPTENAKVVLHLKTGAETKEITLNAQPLDGETAEKSSRFVAAADQFPEAVKDIEEVTGSLAVTTGADTKTVAIEHDHGDGHAH